MSFSLDTLAQNQKLKLLLIGESGAGKTCFSCSGEGETFIFDFDNKVSSAASFYGEKNPARLKQLHAEQFPLAKSQAPYLHFRKMLAELEGLAKEGKFPYETVVLDSLTLYADSLMAYVIERNPDTKRAFKALSEVDYKVPAMQDYLVNGVYFREDMNKLLSLPCNVVCIAHSSMKETEDGGMKPSILIAGKLADHLPRIFSEVYWAFVRSTPGDAPGKPSRIEHFAQTRSDGRYTCRTQIPKMPMLIPLDLKVIQAYLKPKAEVKPFEPKAQEAAKSQASPNPQTLTVK